MARKKLSEIAKEVVNSVVESKVENKPVVEQVENKVEIREEKKMAEKKIKLRHRHYNPKTGWEWCETTGNMSIADIGCFEMNKGYIEVDEAKASEILEKTRCIDIEIDEKRKPRKVVRDYWLKA